MNWDLASWYPMKMEEQDIFKFKEKLNELYGLYSLKRTENILTKCMKCAHSYKVSDGTYICKYSEKNGEPNTKNCHYERKTI